MSDEPSAAVKVLTWYTSPDVRIRHDNRTPLSAASTCVCGTCGATYSTDGDSDGPEDLFTHMVRRHVTMADLMQRRDVVIMRVEQTEPGRPVTPRG